MDDLLPMERGWFPAINAMNDALERYREEPFHDEFLVALAEAINNIHYRLECMRIFDMDRISNQQRYLSSLVDY